MGKKSRTLGQVLTYARESLDPVPSYEQIARRLDGVEVSFQTVINYHKDAVDRTDVEIIQALVDYYGLKLADLPADVQARLTHLRDRLVAASKAKRHPSSQTKRYAPRDSNPEPADIDLVTIERDERHTQSVTVAA